VLGLQLQMQMQLQLRLQLAIDIDTMLHASYRNAGICTVFAAGFAIYSTNQPRLLSGTSDPDAPCQTRPCVCIRTGTGTGIDMYVPFQGASGFWEGDMRPKTEQVGFLINNSTNQPPIYR
jgi:hypothetical protein